MKRGRFKHILSETAQYAGIIILVLAVRSALAQPFYVPSGSMEPTLQIGDELIASKYAYGYSRYSLPLDVGPASDSRLFQRLPERGDVVVFRLPRDTSVVYVKRVIGLPGDRIRMHSGRLEINGETLPLEDVAADVVELQDGRRIPARRLTETLPGGRRHPILKLTWSGLLDETPEITVPDGMLFMMGDDRDNSLDSRVAAESGGVGFVPVENLIGRAEIVIGSWDFPIMNRPVGEWLSGLRLSRFFTRIS
ncbi:MAG TPA: signal peptidase I [Candidatus Sulfotelmatobacter sp.]|jgi:signal peptidase I|nr:signal peptidase I [Candidatus Sulfotelmatobacter sp.]